MYFDDLCLPVDALRDSDVLLVNMVKYVRDLNNHCQGGPILYE